VERNPNGLSAAEIDTLVDELNAGLEREVVLRFLQRLPDDEHPDFYRQLTELLRVDDQGRLEERLRDILESEAVEVERDAEFVRFAAFEYLATYYRRNYDHSTLRAFYSQHRDDFRERPLYRLGEARLLAFRDEYKSGLRQVREVIEETGQQKDVIHEFSRQVASGYEDGKLPAEDREELMKEAMAFVNIAINRDQEYGRYYQTKARLLALQGAFDEAGELIETAIENEDTSRSDYRWRINMYNLTRTEVEARSTRERLKAEMEENVSTAVERLEDDVEKRIESLVDAETATMREELREETMNELANKSRDIQQRTEEMESRYIQILGFFTGFLVIAVTTTNVARLPFEQAAQLVFLLTSGLLVAISGFGILLPGLKSTKRSIVVMVLGFAGLVLSVVLFPAVIG